MVQTKIDYKTILRHHTGFALTMFTIVLVAVGVGSVMQPKVYRTEAEIYIASRPVAVTGDAATAMADSDYRTMNNQMEILKSDAVLQRAVAFIREKQLSEGGAKVVKAQNAGGNVAVSEGMLQGALAIAKKDYTSVISLSLTGPFQPAEMARMLGLYIDAYMAELKDIEQKKSKDEVVFLDRQIAESQTRLNEAGIALQHFEATHQAYNLDAQAGQLIAMAGRMDENTRSTQAEINALERQIASAQGHLPAKAEFINMMARVERDTEASDLRKQIVNLEAERAEWASKLTDAHPKMQAYNRELARKKAMLAARLQSFGGLSAETLATGSNLDTTVANDVINSQIKLDALRARARSLSASHTELMGQLGGVPQEAIAAAKLRNEFDMLQEKVRTLQKRRDEATLNGEASQSFTKVVTLKKPGVPGDPLHPNLQKNLTAAALLGMLLALFSVFIRASLDRTLRWPFQLEGLLQGLPGLIPANVSNGAMFANGDAPVFSLPPLVSRGKFAPLLEKTNFAVPEPYKRLVIHFESLAKSNGVRRIGVLPVGALDNTAMTTVALSLYLTELSNKMLLIDVDYGPHSVTALMRSLKTSGARELQEGPGLSDYMAGATEDFIDIIYPLGKTVYGSFIPSGDPVTDTGFQFSHRNLGALEENLSPNYNFVLYALPPITQSYDALAVARTLDAVILITHPHQTPLDALQSTLSELSAITCPVLGVLFQPLGR